MSTFITSDGQLEVDGQVRKLAILDNGAGQIMLRNKFASRLPNCHPSLLDAAGSFITTSEAEEKNIRRMRNLLTSGFVWRPQALLHYPTLLIRHWLWRRCQRLPRAHPGDLAQKVQEDDKSDSLIRTAAHGNVSLTFGDGVTPSCTTDTAGSWTVARYAAGCTTDSLGKRLDHRQPLFPGRQ